MIAVISPQSILIGGVAAALIVCGVFTLVNIAIFGLNLKLCTELMKDRNMAARSRSAPVEPAAKSV